MIEIAVGFEVFAEFLEGAFWAFWGVPACACWRGDLPLGKLNDLFDGEIEVEWDNLGGKVVDQIDFVGETVNVHLESW